jgi:hypothetical protein
MTMHLEGPWLTTTGKIRSKRRKYASADAARKERELRAEWEQRQAEWDRLAPRFGSGRVAVAKTVRLSPQYPPGREPKQHIPSVPDTPGAVAARPADKVYTGTKIKGIGTMHKSNAVPIFSDDEAQDIARMRR